MGELKNIFDVYKTKNVIHCVSKIVNDFFESTEEPVLISVGGPGGTGKTTFSIGLAGALLNSSVFSLDDYKTPRQKRKKEELFGPHPDANEMELISMHLQGIKNNVVISKPIYNPALGYADKKVPYIPSKYNILDGEISTYGEFKPIVDFMIFIDSHQETQLNTRLTRDIQEKGYSREEALATFQGSNMKEFKEFGMETKEWCDISIFCEEDYSLSLEGISQRVKNKVIF